jgi:5'-nucleotidase
MATGATPSSGNGRKHQVLISNDDGIQAPGLKALVEALSKSGDVQVYVCAPSGERSAQSHAITLGRYLSCFSSEVPGAEEVG